MSLPRSATLAIWLNACLRGSVGVDDFAAAVTGDDPQHLVVGWPGADGPLALTSLPPASYALTDPRVGLALPMAGHPIGLAGPAAFNADALETGEAVLLGGRARSLGLVPMIDARTVLWQVSAAERPAILDPREEARALRAALLTATAELVRLDVASWSPEVADLLMNLHHRPDPVVPPGTEPDGVATLDRATLCLEVVALARADDGGSVTAYETSARHACLTDLDLAARRAIVAVCSASLLGS